MKNDERAVQLPSGTVTLLLADVESSTRAWEEQAAQMRSSMSSLDALIDEVAARCGGARPLEQGEGDSFVVAFARASDAVAAALALQIGLVDGPIAVRMALHTGEVELRDESRYDGPVIIRTARLRDLAHGGQTLLSSSTRDLVQDALPDGVDLIDLGSHQLKDLDRAERAYQLTHPALQGRFPPIRSSPASAGNLPVPLTSFVGRVLELEEARRLVGEHRLVTLTGAGGCGKTRLAIEVSRLVPDMFPDGVWFCDLGPLSDPSAVAQTLRTTMGVREDRSRDDTESVCLRLSGLAALVVLDNCEHLVDASARLADAILKACPNVHIITTSREPVGVESEVAWRVPSLRAPENGSDRPEDLLGYDAVRLFVDRAAHARPGFALTAESAASVAEICKRLDGIPLALELAAARVRVLSVRDLASGINDRFRLLGRGSRTVLARQQTLEASVGWSHDMLSGPQKVVLRRLAVFAGTFTLAGAEHVVSGGEVQQADVLELLSQLVDRSLVVADDTGSGTSYRLLETIRQYARERLVASGEAKDVSTSHLDFHADWAVNLLAELRGGKGGPLETRAAIDVMYDNLREACEWAIVDGHHESGLRLATSLWDVWIRSFATSSGMRVREGRRWLDELLRDTGDAPPHARVAASAALAHAMFIEGEVIEGGTLARDAIPLAREIGNLSHLSYLLQRYGFSLSMVDRAQGVAVLEESVQVARDANDPAALWQAQYFLGQALGYTGERGLAAVREGLAVAQQANLSAEPLRQVYGFALYQAGDVDAGINVLEDSRAWFAAAGEPEWTSRAETFLACALWLKGDSARAREHAARALSLADADTPERAMVALMARFALAWMAVDEGRIEDADEEFSLISSDASDADERTDGLHMVAMMYGDVISGLRAINFVAAGDREKARRTIDAGTVAPAQIPFLFITALTLGASAIAARAMGEIEEAERHVHEGLTVISDLGPRVLAPDLLDVAAALRSDVGADADAVRLWAAATSARTRMGTVRRPNPVLTISDDIAAARSRLGEDAFTDAWSAGEVTELDDAVAFALRGWGPRRRPPAGWDSLTPTELKVVALVAEGLTNPQIGERLFVSKRTVSAHLRNVFGKLGVSTRAELAAEATRRGV